MKLPMHDPKPPKPTRICHSSSTDMSSVFGTTFSKDAVVHELKKGALRLYRSQPTNPDDDGESQPLINKISITLPLSNPTAQSGDERRRWDEAGPSSSSSDHRNRHAKQTIPAAHGSMSISAACRSSTFPTLPDTKQGVSWVVTSFLLVNAALGIGILNFPSAYSQAGGIFSATVIQLVMLVLMMTTMLILAYCSDVNGDVTYHDTILSMCGHRAQRLAAVSIMCTLYCVCVAIFIIIGDQVDRLFLSVFGSKFCHHWYLERHFTIPAVAICLVLPMCYSKRADFLRYAGSIGIFAMLYPVFLTVYGYFMLGNKPTTIKTYPDDMVEMFAVIPVLCLGYQSQEVVIPIYSCMKERNLCNFTKSSFLAMGFLLTIYSITGIFGYLTFGSDVAHNVMKMYNADDPVVMVGVGALIIKMVATYPILALCGRDAMGGLYGELKGLTADEFVKGERWRRYVLASLWFSTSLLLAVCTSSIGIVIKLLGSVASVNIFVYPGICLLRVVLQNDPHIVTWRNLFLTFVAVVLAGIGSFCFGVILFETILTGSQTEAVEVLCS